MTPQEKRKQTILTRFGSFRAIGLKAKQTNLERNGDDFYKRIGAIGGHNGVTGGFASETVGSDGLTGKERASQAGRIGGMVSRKKRIMEREVVG